MNAGLPHLSKPGFFERLLYGVLSLFWPLLFVGCLAIGAWAAADRKWPVVVSCGINALTAVGWMCFGRRFR